MSDDVDGEELGAGDRAIPVVGERGAAVVGQVGVERRGRRELDHVDLERLRSGGIRAGRPNPLEHAASVVGDERERPVLVCDELGLVPLMGPQQNTQGESHRDRLVDRAPYGG